MAAAGIEPAVVSAPRAERFYLPELDTLRFFAFLSVFVYHSSLIGNPAFRRALGIGSYGVDLFFALSAYLITKLLLKEREECGQVNVRAFIVRRGLRTWPLYFLFLIFVSPALVRFGAALPLMLIFAGNFLMAFHPLPGSVMPLWSLSIEEQFYFTWPWFMRRASPQSLVMAGVVLWLGSIASRCALMLFSSTVRRNPDALWYLTFTRLDSIACGILMGVLLPFPNAKLHRRWPIALLGAALWIFAAALAPRSAGAGVLAVVVAYVAVALGSGAFIVATIGNRTLAVRPLIYLGRISYGLYVFHAAMGLAVMSWLRPLVSGPWYFVACPLQPRSP